MDAASIVYWSPSWSLARRFILRTQRTRWELRSLRFSSECLTVCSWRKRDTGLQSPGRWYEGASSPRGNGGVEWTANYLQDYKSFSNPNLNTDNLGLAFLVLAEIQKPRKPKTFGIIPNILVLYQILWCNNLACIFTLCKRDFNIRMSHELRT